MNRQIKIIGESSASKFEKRCNDAIIDGWVPHWDTFKISFADSRIDTFYMLFEKKIEGNK